jgi:hypothetical protein
MILTWIVAATAWGQTVEMTPAAVDRGSANIFRILLHPQAGKPADKPLLALQWELAVPRGLQIEASGVVAGAAADQAGKSVNCATRTDPKNGKICLCILVGGAQKIQEGAIAIVKVSAAADAQRGNSIVRMQKILGVSPDLKGVELADATTQITIR